MKSRLEASADAAKSLFRDLAARPSAASGLARWYGGVEGKRALAQRWPPGWRRYKYKRRASEANVRTGEPSPSVPAHQQASVEPPGWRRYKYHALSAPCR